MLLHQDERKFDVDVERSKTSYFPEIKLNAIFYVQFNQKQLLVKSASKEKNNNFSQTEISCQKMDERRKTVLYNSN